MRSVGNIFLQACQSGCEAAVQVWCPAKHRASPEHHQEARLGSLSSCWAGGCSPGSEVGSTDGRCGREKMHAAEGFVKEMGWFAPQPQGTRFLVRSVWQLCCPAMSRWNFSTGILKTFKNLKQQSDEIQLVLYLPAHCRDALAPAIETASYTWVQNKTPSEALPCTCLHWYSSAHSWARAQGPLSRANLKASPCSQSYSQPL